MIRFIILSLLCVFAVSSYAETVASTPATTLAPVPAVVQAGTVIPNSTPVPLILVDPISSAYSHIGEPVRFTVAKDVTVNGHVVISAGTLALGTVTQAQPKRWAGRAGKLSVSIQSVTGVDGSKIMLSGSETGKGASHVGRMAVGMVAVTAVTFGAGGALFLFMHGKDITFPAGTKVTMFTVGNARVKSLDKQATLE